MMKTNDLEPLSNNLTTITTEIKTYEAVTSQSIFEIGRRLNWVKRHDLAHGEFREWLKSINLNYRQANRFMKVASELPNVTTWSHLGTRVLYEVATLPKPQQQEVEEQVKQGNNPTVKEITELKRQLKQHEQTIADQQAELEDNRKTQIELNQRLSEAHSRQPEPQVVTKTVTKEVKPDDYDKLKAGQEQFKQRYNQLAQQLANTRKQMSKLANDYDDVNRKYSEAKEAVSSSQVEWAKNKADYSIYRLTKKIDDFVSLSKPLDFQTDVIRNASDESKQRINKSLDEASDFIDDLRAIVNGKKIVEGEVINNG